MIIRDEMLKGCSIYDLKLRVTYYARVSTDNDSQNSSITNQVDFFHKYISNINNWILVNGYVDEGISGKDAKKRDSFLRMINDGVNNKFDLILTKSVSRFARNTIDSIRYTDLLKSKGVYVIFINDNINTFSSDSEFRLTLMASIAQDEVRKLSESVRFGLKQSIDRGVVLGSSNILGYKKNKGKLVIVKKEASIVRDIFDMFVTDRYSYSEVARIINSKYNRNFDSTSIKRILTNYKYKGYYCGKKSMVVDYKNSKRVNIDRNDWVIYKDDRKVPVIVKEDVWDRVNDIIEKRSNKRDKNKSKYEGRIVCGIHKKKYRHIVKKYKDRCYSYFCCRGCNTIREDFIDRVCLKYRVNYVIIYRYEDMLKIVLNIN